MKSPRILGIDPGSRITGFGVIEQKGFHNEYVSCGVIKSNLDFTLPDRLKEMYEGICEVIETYQPDHAAIENVFVAKNPNSALKLGQARGVLMLAVRQYQIDLYEYSAKVVKQAVVGYGQADKHQIQQAVRALLKLSSTPSQDAADALAVAMCCSNHLAVSHNVS
ncbi:MAG: crossover junction endodeoxyribonuclease RuvC [Desulfobulbaceae bacterium]|uniref:Crossover junction endodeoxyribonuclease RuvC n=1 Tax=Candidatus Desulfobia pelagia TaxID=2841692 RepID=A0A8J6NCX1_9BACT|nr:crossover junction endodeoxyribonuclease RuvC [Candidatus Desulfobia pelagia]